MSPEQTAFLEGLLGRCDTYHGTACLTFTALHPDGQRPSPSRHVRVGDTATLSATLDRLDEANRQGWGAYLAVGLRRPGLSRWRRGGMGEVVALPALFVDVDDPSADALKRLRHFPVAPSCIVHSGGGYHAYWWLDQPTTDLDTARLVLRALAACLGGDRLSVAQSLRWIGSINTKPAREGAHCHIIDLTDRRCPLTEFTPLLPQPRRPSIRPIPKTDDLAAAFLMRGYRGCGDWLNGPCPYPHRHKHGDRRPSFGFNTRTGYGFCHVCGSMLSKDLCVLLNVSRAAYPIPHASAGALTPDSRLNWSRHDTNHVPLRLAPQPRG